MIKYFVLLLFILNFTSQLYSCKLPVHGFHNNQEKIKNQLELHNFEIRQNGLDNFVESESGLFRVHYNTSGEHSVPLDDLDQNGVPDYVDSTLYFAEFSYNFFVNQQSWKKPAIDGGKGGSDAYDIYLLEIGNDDAGGIYGSEHKENPIFDENDNIIGFSTYIVVDNDFSKFDSTLNRSGEKIRTYFTTGFKALKSTVAHEFHHQIQDNYLISASQMFFEMTSVFMERRVFPDSRDFLQYTRVLFSNPDQWFLTSDDYRHGYPYGLFWDFIYERFDTDRIIRRTWEILSENSISEIQAIDQAIRTETGTHDLDLAYCEFAKWCYNSSESKEPTFELTEEFPRINSIMDTIFNDENISFTRDLPPYSFSLAKFTFPEFQETTDDSLHVLFANSNLNNAIDFNDKKSLFGFQIGTINSSNEILLEEINQEVEIIDFDEVFCYELLEYPGVSSVISGKTFPSPFKLDQNQYIYFEVPEGTLLYDDLELQILNPEMQVIYTDEIMSSYFNSPQLESEFGSGVRVAQFDIDLLKNPQPGVYIYQIINNDKSVFGKFIITK